MVSTPVAECGVSAPQAALTAKEIDLLPEKAVALARLTVESHDRLSQPGAGASS